MSLDKETNARDRRAKVLDKLRGHSSLKFLKDYLHDD
jgi:hypothetical protein